MGSIEESLGVELPQPIYLEPFYDLHAQDRSQFGAWESVPKGPQLFDGVPFDVTGMIRLYGTIPPPHGTVYRMQVKGIPVRRRFDQLHVLHGTGWGESDGTEVARMILNYDDGATAQIPLVYGIHVRDWWERAEDAPVAVGVEAAGSGVAWRKPGQPVTLRFYRSSFINPHPEKRVESIDLLSQGSEATPAIVALTAGPAIPGIPADLISRGDERERVLVRVVDAASGDPVEGAVLQIGYCDDGGCPRLGTFATDSTGGREIEYPTRNLRSFTVMVYAAGYEPKSVILDLEAGDPIPAELTLRLE